MTATMNFGTGFGRSIMMIEKMRRVDQFMDTGTILCLLYIAQYPGITIKELEKLTEIGRSSTSRHVLVLTERGDVARNRKGLGLVEHYDDLRDARVKHCRLTEKGKELMREIQKITTLN